MAERVARCWMDAEAYALTIYQMCSRLAGGGTIGPESSTNKIFWSEMDLHMHETALALLGPRALIGISCGPSLERARQAASEGADYLAFGRFYPSHTKPDAPGAEPAVLARALGVPIAKSMAIPDAKRVVAAVNEIGGPVVLKILSPDIAHKTEAGGVTLGLADGQIADTHFP